MKLWWAIVIGFNTAFVAGIFFAFYFVLALAGGPNFSG
jgi:hypothetical protein